MWKPTETHFSTSRHCSYAKYTCCCVRSNIRSPFQKYRIYFVRQFKSTRVSIGSMLYNVAKRIHTMMKESNKVPHSRVFPLLLLLLLILLALLLTFDSFTLARVYFYVFCMHKNNTLLCVCITIHYAIHERFHFSLGAWCLPRIITCHSHINSTWNHDKTWKIAPHFSSNSNKSNLFSAL